ncbi:hypothetical protein LCGC14_1169370 [marine sediment metagenome]|uniref:Uncharacterized protein n=1 Tax=marine sediment metagenome TaxID=412755 RepID=A0A0F9P8J1_9ZZZZ
MTQLEEQIKVVMETRQYSKKMAGQRTAMYNSFMEENANFFGDVATAASVVSEAEALLRELTLKAYTETGSKNPAVGVGIREVTTYSYDSVVALAWGMEHGLCLKLDDTAFKKQVKISPLPFVTATTEPQATIATDLEIKV